MPCAKPNGKKKALPTEATQNRREGIYAFRKILGQNLTEWINPFPTYERCCEHRGKNIGRRFFV